MGYLIGCLVVGCVGGMIVAVPLAFLWVWGQSKAKQQAKRILREGRIRNQNEFDQVCSILSRTTDDLEAADLWKRLQELKEPSSAKTPRRNSPS